MHARISLVLFALLACGSRTSTSEPSRPPVREPAPPGPSTPLRVTAVPAGVGIEGVVRIEPGGKGVDVVWLERTGGERLLLAYRPLEWLKRVEGRVVRVTGETHVPRGQAIMATHYRVDTLWVLADASEVPILGFGPQTTLTGTLVKKTGPAGSQSAEEPYRTFVTTDGTEYLVEHAPDDLTEGVQTQVQARALAPSMQHTARPDGSWLWVVEVGPGAAF